MSVGPWPVSHEAVRGALPHLFHSGRWEPVPGFSAFLDGAHNPEAAEHLVRQIQTVRQENGKVAFLAGFLREKDWRSMVHILAEAADAFFLTVPPGTNGVEPSTIASYLTEQRPGIDCHAGSFREICQSAFNWVAGEPDRILVVTGSLYLVAGVQKWLAGDDSPLHAGERTSASPPS